MRKICQLGLVSADLPGTLQLYSEGFGFHNAGATCLWGGATEKITNARPDARNMIWWLVGERSFFQFELFHYTCPKSQPIPTDWRPSDQGWSRFGVVVRDFDKTLAGLKKNGVEPITAPIVRDGRRRAAIRDPYVGIVIEVIESDPKNPEGPYVSYATNSVADIEEARRRYQDILQFDILPLGDLHQPEDEALWGLAGAQREGFLAQLGDFTVEVVQYQGSRPKPVGYQISDQGFMNIAVASTQMQPIVDTLDRLVAGGIVPPHIYNDGKIVAAYTIEPDCVLEYGVVPEELHKYYGFVPAQFDFLGGEIELKQA